MNEDVAKLVEKLERVTYTRERGDGPNGTYFDEPCQADDRDAVASLANPDGPEAASTIRAQASEIERLRDAMFRKDKPSPMTELLGAATKIGRLEAKLRDADEVIQRLNSGAELQAIMAAHNDTLAKLREAVEVIQHIYDFGLDRLKVERFLTDMEKRRDP